MARKQHAATCFSLAALASSAVQVLAPNSLQFNEHEFQQSPKEAQDAAREAAKLVKPGDLVFITTSGLVYSVARYLTGNAYDHVVIVLDEHVVLHVGSPSVRLMPLERLLLPQRQPVVLRVSMSETELQLFLRSARQLIGCQYDIVRTYQLMLRLTLKHLAGSSPLPRLPLDVKSNAWICSDSIVLLHGVSRRITAGEERNGARYLYHWQRLSDRFSADLSSSAGSYFACTLANRQLHHSTTETFMASARFRGDAIHAKHSKWDSEVACPAASYLSKGAPTCNEYLSDIMDREVQDRNIMFHAILRLIVSMTEYAQAAEVAGAIPTGGLCLLVIDQQVDFHPGGSLAIPKASEDAARIAAFIQKHSRKLKQLVFTLDSHQRYHIAHGIFWENAKGDSPEPFTIITAKDVAAGVWRPRDPSLKEYVLAYTSALDASCQFTLCIWPEHCLIGSPGHNIVSIVHAEAVEWAKVSLKPVQYVMKGNNSFTEHYSALKAEFELPYDPATSLNKSLVESLQLADKVIVCGEALSHCLNYTVRDLVAAWPKDRRSDLVILTDCTSPIPGYEKAGEGFLRDMAAEGLTLTMSAQFSA